MFCYTIVKKERRFFLLKDEHSAADEKIDDGESSEISVLLYASKRKNKSVRENEDDSFPQSIYPLSLTPFLSTSFFHLLSHISHFTLLHSMLPFHLLLFTNNFLLIHFFYQFNHITNTSIVLFWLKCKYFIQ